MKKNHWKTVLSSLVTLALLVGLIYFIFRDDYAAILQNIRSVALPALVALLAAGTSTALLDAVITLLLVRRRKADFRYSSALSVVYIGVFGNTATVAVGSMPMQSLYLHHYGLQAGRSLSIMALQYVFLKCTVLLYATLMLLLQGRWLFAARSDLARYILMGYGVFALVILAMVLVCTWDKLLHLAQAALRRLPDSPKWAARKRSWSENLESLYAESQSILRDRKCLAAVLAVYMLRFFCLYSLPWFCFRMLGVDTLSFAQVQLLGALMYLITGALPNVAGMGPAEFAFLLLFSASMSSAQVSSALVLFRTATFFFPFLVSAVVFFFVQKRMVRDKTEGNERPDTERP
jgi:hypothetical protein